MTTTHCRSIGQRVHVLIARQVRALVDGQAPVLANKDPEPLHQMRVAMRRLRVTLEQFEPLVVLPQSLRLTRLAKTSRRLGIARDLDVLEHKLESEWLPGLGSKDLKLLRPALKQLRHERLLAHRQVAEQLKGPGYLAWLAQMQGWLRKPQWTPLADERWCDWLVQWQLGWISALFVHPAWTLDQLPCGAQLEQLHDLRKLIKRSRYQLDNSKPLRSHSLLRAHQQLKAMQDLLGQLNDLQVLQQALEDQLPGPLSEQLPDLHQQVQQQQQLCWQQWRIQAAGFCRPTMAGNLIAALERERAQAQLRQHCWHVCSWIHGAVAQDWRGVFTNR